MTPLAVERALLGVDRIALLVYECHDMKPCHEEIVRYIHSRCNDQYISFAGEEEVWGSKRGACFHAPDEEISVPNPGSRLNDDEVIGPCTSASLSFGCALITASHKDRYLGGQG